MKLDKVKFALAAGIVWGLGMFFLTLFVKDFGIGWGMLLAVGSLYIGDVPTWGGAFIGLILGFCDAFVGAFIFVWIYNALLGKLE